MTVIKSNESNGVPINTQPPPWFTAFEARLDGRIDTNKNLFIKLIADYKTEIQRKLDHVRQNFNCLLHNQIVIDDCEIRLSGIPRDSSFEPFSIINKVLTTCNIPHMIAQVISWRSWNLSNAAVSASTQQGHRNHSETLIFQVTSPVVRNLILRHSAILKSHTAQTIFGTGGTSKIYLSALWPKSTYNLLRKAQKVAMQLGYAPPTVRNLIVCMRQTKSKTSVLIPITSEADLVSLKSLLSPPSSTAALSQASSTVSMTQNSALLQNPVLTTSPQNSAEPTFSINSVQSTKSTPPQNSLKCTPPSNCIDTGSLLDSIILSNPPPNHIRSTLWHAVSDPSKSLNSNICNSFLTPDFLSNRKTSCEQPFYNYNSLSESDSREWEAQSGTNRLSCV